MYHVDNPSTVTEKPEPEAVTNPVTQWFTDLAGGDGAPTYPGADWFNIVQAELLNILIAAGIEPSKTDLTQLTQAIEILIANAGSTPVTPAVNSVGSYAFLGYNDLAAHHTLPGDIVSGDLLRFAGISVITGSPVPLGSWQCMGATTNADDHTLFIRIS